jgi:hypothetical protein
MTKSSSKRTGLRVTCARARHAGITIGYIDDGSQQTRDTLPVLDRVRGYVSRSSSPLFINPRHGGPPRRLASGRTSFRHVNSSGGPTSRQGSGGLGNEAGKPFASVDRTHCF